MDTDPIDFERVPFDLSDRFVAGLGGIGLTLAAFLAGFSRVMSEHWQEKFDADVSRGLLGFLDLTWIAVLYFVSMLAVAWVLAIRPGRAKLYGWGFGLMLVCGLFLAVVAGNLGWMFRCRMTVI